MKNRGGLPSGMIFNLHGSAEANLRIDSMAEMLHPIRKSLGPPFATVQHIKGARGQPLIFFLLNVALLLAPRADVVQCGMLLNG